MSGLLGSMGFGGGFILLIYLNLFTNALQPEAKLTNLLFFIPIASLSVFLHSKNKLLEKSVIKKSVLSGAIGVLIGCILAQIISNAILSKLFGVFIILAGIRELFGKEQNDNTEN